MKKFLPMFCCVTAIAACADNAHAAEVSEYLNNSLSPLALNNVLKAERVFCYNVEMPTEDYTGYTLDQMAITGFCGMLRPQESTLIIDELMKKESSLSEKQANCVIKPRILFRFYRGVDSTDVLFSSPCPSLTFFYGGTLQSFNAAPVAEAIKKLSETFEEKRTDFVSPALLNQLMPIGVASTDEQKALVAKQKQVQPKRNWVKPEEELDNEQPAKQEPKGWNKINIKKN